MYTRIISRGRAWVTSGTGGSAAGLGRCTAVQLQNLQVCTGWRCLSTNPDLTMFDRPYKRLQRETAARLATGDHDYLKDYVAEELIDRLNDITRSFPVAVDLGGGGGHIARRLNGEGDIKHLYVTDTSEAAVLRGLHSDTVKLTPLVCDDELLPFGEGTIDLFMSNLNMHWVNDLLGTMTQVRKALKPDGAFMCAMLGGDTLEELRSSLVAAEMDRRGGVGAHMSPLVFVADMGALLTEAGFRLPTVDSQKVTIEYPSAISLMMHLQNMGESNALAKRSPLNMDTLLAAAAAYQSMHGNEDGSVSATFHIVYMIGWAPHESQPKPLRRGSATHSLKDVGSVSLPEPPAAAAAAASSESCDTPTGKCGCKE